MSQKSLEQIDADIQKYEDKIAQFKKKISALQKKRTEIKNSQILTAIDKLNMPLDEVIEYISLIKNDNSGNKQEVNL